MTSYHYSNSYPRYDVGDYLIGLVLFLIHALRIVFALYLFFIPFMFLYGGIIAFTEHTGYFYRLIFSGCTFGCCLLNWAANEPENFIEDDMVGKVAGWICEAGFVVSVAASVILALFWVQFWIF